MLNNGNPPAGTELPRTGAIRHVGRVLPALALMVGLLAAGSIALAGLLAGGARPVRAAGLTPPKAAPATGPAVCAGWRVVPSSDPVMAPFTNLYGVAAVSATDGWSVGYSSDGSTLHTVIEHWNGSAWALVADPHVGAGSNTLQSVAAVSSSDVWAVGYYDNGTVYQTLIAHWDGSAWAVVPSPNFGTGSNYLTGVTAVSSTDVWAVGDYRSGGLNQTLIEHWNGSAWTIVTSPNVGTAGNVLNAVAAVSSTDVWAVGYYSNGTAYQPLTLHWTGSAWVIVFIPAAGTADNYLYGVAAGPGGDVWAVGNYAGSTATRTLIEHWTGSSWAIVPSPNVGSDNNYLSGVTAVASNDAWAVGYDRSGTADETLTAHWDGSTWSVIPSLNPGSGYNDLYGVDAVSGSNVWAVGYYDPGTGSGRTLVEQYLDSCPTATPTPCPITFTDVPADNPFSPYIRCLACRGIVSGYTTSPPCATGTPCFQPGANVTRGQMAKFVANAAGYNDPIPSTQQTFTDVPYGSPFWLYVERAVLHGVISGYTTSPPCTTGAPCFLPGNNVTRGQTAKFVSNAANYADAIPSTQQTFTDVPGSSPFWVYTERAYAHGVISGYTTSPPCSTGTPCFGPGNNVTRGQTSKFIANGFFPGCVTPARR
ncbi:MAG TPA: S-layer homology domain-containing protein [Chloroflexia bacterium]|nr:S-layer homology domain-containing protein [Chloroflexia bacterium]